jgi:hypothetical protein
VRPARDQYDVALHNPRTAADAPQHYADVVSGHSISTYAWDRATQRRIGDPICDDWSARVTPDRGSLAVLLLLLFV